MPTVSEVLEQARELIEDRLSEIDAERRRLERAHAALGGGGSSRNPGRPRSPGSAPASRAPSAPRRRRRRRGGTRGEEAVELITRRPGIGASDVAKAMKIKPSYLYKVLGDLEKEGRVKKDGRRYYPGRMTAS